MLARKQTKTLEDFMNDSRIRAARFVLPALAILLAGCSGAPSPAIPVTGPTGSIARLEGSWAGDYRLAETMDFTIN